MFNFFQIFWFIIGVFFWSDPVCLEGQIQIQSIYTRIQDPASWSSGLALGEQVNLNYASTPLKLSVNSNGVSLRFVQEVILCWGTQFELLKWKSLHWVWRRTKLIQTPENKC